MEKRVKGLLVAGTVACGLGAAMFGAGAAFGGGDYVSKADLNKLDGSARLDDSISTEKIEIEDFDRINAEIKDVDFKILPSEDENYYLSYQIRNARREEPVEYKIEDGTLELSEQKSDSGISMQVDLSFISYLMGGKARLAEEEGVVLYVPEGKKFEESRISMADGNLVLEGFESQNIELEQSFGDMVLKDCTLLAGTVTSEDGKLSASRLNCKDTELSFHFGNLSLDTAVLEDCTLEISDGDLFAEELAVLGDTVIEDRFGNVRLQLAEAGRESLSVELETKFGDIELEGGWDGAGSMQKEMDRASYQKMAEKPAGSLKVTLEDGDITLG